MEDETQEEQHAPKTEAIISFLAEEGYRPRLDDDKDIIFKIEGRTFLIYPYEEDPTYFLITCVISVEEYTNPNAYLNELISLVGSEIKCVKPSAIQAKDPLNSTIGVSFSVEAFYSGVEDFTRVFHRITGAINYAFNKYNEYLEAAVEEGRIEERPLVD